MQRQIYSGLGVLSVMVGGWAMAQPAPGQLGPMEDAGGGVRLSASPGVIYREGDERFDTVEPTDELGGVKIDRGHSWTRFAQNGDVIYTGTVTGAAELSPGSETQPPILRGDISLGWQNPIPTVGGHYASPTVVLEATYFWTARIVPRPGKVLPPAINVVPLEVDYLMSASASQTQPGGLARAFGRVGIDFQGYTFDEYGEYGASRFGFSETIEALFGETVDASPRAKLLSPILEPVASELEARLEVRNNRFGGPAPEPFYNGSASILLDPVYRFDQALFDEMMADKGLESFDLDSFYAMEFSPQIGSAVSPHFLRLIDDPSDPSDPTDPVIPVDPTTPAVIPLPPAAASMLLMMPLALGLKQWMKRR